MGLPVKLEKISTLRDLLREQAGALASVIPKHLTAERLIRIACAAASREPKLLLCTPASVLSAVMTAAQLGLEPGVLGMSYLVPFNNRKTGKMECQFIPGYRGLVDIARRTGMLIDIDADVVYEGDGWKYKKGLERVLEHCPKMTGHRGKIICAYAIAHLKDGGVQITVMTLDEVDAIRARSKSSSGPWDTDYAEMAKKTVLKRLAKLLPASVELRQAVALDDRGESGDSQVDVLAEMPVVADVPELEASYGEVPDFVEQAPPRAQTQAEEMKARLEAKRAEREPGMEG